MTINEKKIKTWNDLKEITLDDIGEYVIKKGTEDMKWLKSILEKKFDVKDKEGNIVIDKKKAEVKKRKISFQEIKVEFINKYFPNLEKKEQKPKQIDQLMAKLEVALKE